MDKQINREKSVIVYFLFLTKILPVWLKYCPLHVFRLMSHPVNTTLSETVNVDGVLIDIHV